MYSLIDQGGGKWRGGLVESGMAGFMTPPLDSVNHMGASLWAVTPLCSGSPSRNDAGKATPASFFLLPSRSGEAVFDSLGKKASGQWRRKPEAGHRTSGTVTAQRLAAL